MLTAMLRWGMYGDSAKEGLPACVHNCCLTGSYTLKVEEAWQAAGDDPLGDIFIYVVFHCLLHILPRAHPMHPTPSYSVGLCAGYCPRIGSYAYTRTDIYECCSLIQQISLSVALSLSVVRASARLCADTRKMRASEREQQIAEERGYTP